MKNSSKMPVLRKVGVSKEAVGALVTLIMDMEDAGSGGNEIKEALQLMAKRQFNKVAKLIEWRMFFGNFDAATLDQIGRMADIMLRAIELEKLELPSAEAEKELAEYAGIWEDMFQAYKEQVEQMGCWHLLNECERTLAGFLEFQRKLELEEKKRKKQKKRNSTRAPKPVDSLAKLVNPAEQLSQLI